jgi:L-asparagine transporter-like permease
MLWLDKETRVALFVAPFWFALLAIGYTALPRRAPDGATT